MNRAVFPLPVFLLPDGYTRLRIFENRYLEMVKEALKENVGFVICSDKTTGEIGDSDEGVYVKIVDFSQDDHQNLLIDVEVQERVRFVAVERTDLNLLRADVTIIDKAPWHIDNKTLINFDKRIVNMLTDVFNENKQVKSLYLNKQFDDPVWVVSRWLELLPIPYTQKEAVRSAQNFDQVVKFLQTILFKVE